MYLVTREIAGYVVVDRFERADRFALRADDQQLDLVIGPLRGGAGRQLART